ncbi:hypothetical protein JCM10207_000921 [Rhodosporidiobolus poonsookiae]
MANEDDSLTALKAREQELRRQLAALDRQPSPSSSSLPLFRPSQPSSHAQLPQGVTPADGDAQELARQYRLVGRSCFPVELARGARAKEELDEVERERKRRKGEGKEREAERDEFVRKGVAVRLETFFAGRFYEPYYVVFARHLPDLDPSDSRSPADPSSLFIAHHTIPHWIPLPRLAWQYLGVRVKSADKHPADSASDEKGGEADMDLFLTQLTPYLNAHISRREQLNSLRSTFSSASHPSLKLRIFSSESCDRIMVEWNLPSPRSSTEKGRGEQDSEEEEEEEAGPMRSVMVQIAFHDLRLERFEPFEGEDGASLLVRCMEKEPDELTPRQTVLQALADKAVGGSLDGGKTVEQVVRALVEETTRTGWTADDP